MFTKYHKHDYKHVETVTLMGHNVILSLLTQWYKNSFFFPLRKDRNLVSEAKDQN
jgi:hypothetical protein